MPSASEELRDKMTVQGPKCLFVGGPIDGEERECCARFYIVPASDKTEHRYERKRISIEPRVYHYVYVEPERDHR